MDRVGVQPLLAAAAEVQGLEREGRPAVGEAQGVDQGGQGGQPAHSGRAQPGVLDPIDGGVFEQGLDVGQHRVAERRRVGPKIQARQPGLRQLAGEGAGRRIGVGPVQGGVQLRSLDVGPFRPGARPRPPAPGGRQGRRRGAGQGVGQIASAPEMISISSLVIWAWRERLYCRLSAAIMSPALRVALSMALIWAA